MRFCEYKNTYEIVQKYPKMIDLPPSPHFLAMVDGKTDDKLDFRGIKFSDTHIQGHPQISNFVVSPIPCPVPDGNILRPVPCRDGTGCLGCCLNLDAETQLVAPSLPPFFHWEYGDPMDSA